MLYILTWMKVVRIWDLLIAYVNYRQIWHFRILKPLNFGTFTHVLRVLGEISILSRAMYTMASFLKTFCGFLLAVCIAVFTYFVLWHVQLLRLICFLFSVS